MSGAYVIGIGVTPMGRFPERRVEDLAAEAILDALADAGAVWRDVEQFYAAHVSQGIAAGQRILKEIGPSGIPVLNIENCAAAASTAMREASLALRAGEYDLVVVAGFEKMEHGRLLDTEPPGSPDAAMGFNVVPLHFALMGRKHMADFGTTAEQFAEISVKNHDHAIHNPKAQYPKPVTREQVLASRMICDPITLLQCSPTTDGAAAAVLCSERYLRRRGGARAVRLLGSALTSDIEEYGHGRHTSLEQLARAANAAYERVAVGPRDLDLVETHDCFTVAELVAYENLGLCGPGEGGRLIDEGATRIGGRIPVNASGGLLAKGHPLGATGVSQIAEIVTQLRGEAGARQVEGARIGLTANMGVGSACVHILAKAT